MADVRSDEDESSALRNLREDLTFRYPEFAKNDQLYLKDYAKFLQTYPPGSVDSFGKNDSKKCITIDEIQAGAQRFHAPNQWPSKNKGPNNLLLILKEHFVIGTFPCRHFSVNIFLY